MEPFNLNENVHVEQMEVRLFESWKNTALETAKKNKRLLEIKSLQVYSTPIHGPWLCVVYQSNPAPGLSPD